MFLGRGPKPEDSLQTARDFRRTGSFLNRALGAGGQDQTVERQVRAAAEATSATRVPFKVGLGKCPMEFEAEG